MRVSMSVPSALYSRLSLDIRSIEYVCLNVIYSGFTLHTNQATPSTPFTPPEIHKADSMPAELLLNQPPTMAPTSKHTMAAARLFRFRLALGAEKRLSSPAKSKYTLVSTTDGISLNPSARVVAILPADWKASNAMGTSSRKSRPEVSDSVSAVSCGIRSAWINATAMRMRIVCTRKEMERVLRRRGPRVREKRVKAAVPVTKATMEMRDFSQPQGLLVGWLEAPRPRKTVFPIFFFSLELDELS